MFYLIYLTIKLPKRKMFFKIQLSVWGSWKWSFLKSMDFKAEPCSRFGVMAMSFKTGWGVLLHPHNCDVAKYYCEKILFQHQIGEWELFNVRRFLLFRLHFAAQPQKIPHHSLCINTSAVTRRIYCYTVNGSGNCHESD